MNTIRKYARKGIAAIVGLAAVAALTFGVIFANAASPTHISDLSGDGITISVGQETTSVSVSVGWNDNNDLTNRPDPERWLSTDADGWKATPVYYYSLDGGETLIELGAEEMALLGLDPEDFTITRQDVDHDQDYLVKCPTGLPTKVITTEEPAQQGQQSVVTEYPIMWFMTMDQDVNQGNADNYAIESASPQQAVAGKVVNTILTDFEAEIAWLDNGNIYGTRNIKGVGDEEAPTFVVKRYINGQEPSAAVVVEGAEVILGDEVVAEGDDYSRTSVSLKNLPMYATEEGFEGEPYIYFIEIAADGICDDEDKGTYDDGYENVDNYSSHDNALYKGGTATLRLENNTSYVIHKSWIDDNSNSRPECELHLYRIAEGSDGTITVEQIYSASPVPNPDPTSSKRYDIASVPTDDECDIEIGDDILPMYDATGHRYVYFAFETGLTGDYVTDVDNSVSSYSEGVQGVFRLPEVMNGEYAKYILNGANVDNALRGIDDLAVTKTFVAPALQSLPSEAEMHLQVKDDNGWRNATVEDIIDKNQVIDSEGNDSYINGMSVDETGAIVLTIDEFTGEIPSVTVNGLKALRYDLESGKRFSYRWIESAITVNGVRSEVAFDEANGYSLANIDKAAPGTSTENTDALFQPVSVVEEDGTTAITNKLVGDAQLVLDKTWTENGVTLTAQEAAGRGLSAQIFVCQNGVPYNNDELGIENGIVTLNGGNSYHADYLVPRYDANGIEYTYTFNELSVEGWTTQLVTTKDVVEVNDVDILQYKAAVSNSTGPGTTIILDVTKEYLDETDSDTRQPVRFAVYRLNEQGGYDLFMGSGEGDDEELWLTSDENWYKRISIGVPEGSSDTVNNYIIKEFSVGDVIADYIVEDKDINTFQVDVPFGEAIDPSVVYADERVVGHVVEPDGENAQNAYNYDVFIRHTHKNAYGYDESYYAGYTLSNRRVGSINLDLSKAWHAGGATPVGSFVVTRASGHDENGDPIPDATYSLSFDLAPDTQDDPTMGLTVISSGAQNINIILSGLDKYDLMGNLYKYTIDEVGIGGHSLTNHTVAFDNDTYKASIAYDHVQLAGDVAHHDGDTYYWSASNDRVDSYDLTANKVWRDYGTMNGVNDRPDVSFNIYRMAVDNDTYAELMENDGTVNHEATAAYVADNMDQGSPYRVDLLWDTTHNDWYWSCDIGEVARYDNNGNRYIYYLVENMKGDTGIYATGYCNGTEQPKETSETGAATSTKIVFTTPQNQLNPTVLLLSDGYTKGSGENADYGDYFSNTVVNYRVADRFVSGMKLWGLQEGWTIPRPDMPQVTIELYRTVEGSQTVSDVAYDSANIVTENNKTYYKDAQGNMTELVLVNSKVLNEASDGDYSYNFTTDFNGQMLPRFDQYGERYMYFVRESPVDVLHNYSERNVSSVNGYFTVENVYGFEDAAEFSVTKIFVDNGAPKIGTGNLAPAKFTLYARAVNRNGSETGTPIVMSTAIVYPEADESGTYTYNFTFDHYTGSTVDANVIDFETADYPLLPYYGPTNRPFKYYVVEAPVPDGTTATTASTGAYVVKPGDTVEVEGIPTTMGDDDVARGEVEFENEYNPDSVAFNGEKVWDDGNNVGIDVLPYHPDAIQMTVYRRWNSSEIFPALTQGEPAVSMDGGDSKDSTIDTWSEEVIVTPDANGKWKFSLTNLDEFAPNGSPYTYYIDEESEIFLCDEDGVLVNNAKAQAMQAQYTASATSATPVTNTLDRRNITVSKKWASSISGVNINANALRELREIGAIPVNMTYALEQRIGNDGTWTPVYNSQGGKVERVIQWSDFTDNSKNGWSITGLPAETPDGQSITYRIKEEFGDLVYYIDENGNTVDTNASGQIVADSNYEGGSISASRGGNATNRTFTFTNTIDMTKFNMVKVWEDNHNQDNTRQPVTFRISVQDANGVWKTYRISNQNGQDYQIGLPGSGDSNSWNNVYVPALKSGLELSAVYIVSEPGMPTTQQESGYWLSSGPTWTKVSGVDTVTMTNKLETDPNSETVTLNATKNYAGENGWAPVTRPAKIEFTLQYLTLGTDPTKAENWVSATTANIQPADVDDADVTENLYITKDQSFQPTLTVPVAANGTTATVTWNNLFRYWRINQTAGVADKISYQIVETMYDDAGNVIREAARPYTANTNGAAPAATDNTNYTASITNTMKSGQLFVVKNWTTNNGQTTLTAEQIAELAGRGILPRNLSFQVQYKANGGDWTNIGDPIVKDAASMITPVSLGSYPTIDRNGREIEYRVVETTDTQFPAVTFGGNGSTTSAVVKPADVHNDASTAVISNSIELGSITVTKNWADDEGADDQRDGTHPDHVVVWLMRDGSFYASARLEQSNNWTATFDRLPVKKSDGVSDSVWTIEEQELETSLEYTVTYTGNNVTLTDGGSKDVGVTNTHIPYVGNITVKKKWNDGIENHDPITVQLMGYTTSKANAFAVREPVVLNEENHWEYTWNDLYLNNPVAEKITYYVTEAAPDGYTYTSTEVNAAKGDTVTIDLVNNLMGSIEISKDWIDAANPQREDITVTVRGVDPGNNKVYGETVTLSAPDWSATVDDLLVYDTTPEHNPVVYTVTEDVPDDYSATYAVNNVRVDAANNVTLEAGTPSVAITNTSDDFPRFEVTATKVFVGDEDFTGVARPEVSFKLYYYDKEGNWQPIDAAVCNSGDAATKAVDFATADGAVGQEATASWSGLLRYWPDATDRQSPIQYKVVELINGVEVTPESMAAAYPYTTTATVDQFVAPATGKHDSEFRNILETTEVDVIKTWTLPANETVESLQAAGVIPEELSFRLECSSNGGLNYSPWGDDILTYSVADLVAGVTLSTKLPMRAANGNELMWRIAEVAVEGDEVVTISNSFYKGIAYGAPADLNADNQFVLHNEVASGDLMIFKIWGGDGVPAEAPVVITLYADGEVYETVTLSEANGWAYTWEDLRVHRANATDADDKIEYSFSEDPIAGYKTYYMPDTRTTVLVADGLSEMSVKNTEDSRDSNTVDISATKIFEGDIEWFNITRPELSFRLSYKGQDGEWHEADSSVGLKAGVAPVKTVTFSDNGVGTVSWNGMLRYWPEPAPASDENSDETADGDIEAQATDGTDGGTGAAPSSKNAEGRGALIEYRVEEVHISGVPYYVSAGSAQIDFTPSATGPYDGTVTNTLKTAPVSLIKSWSFNGDELSEDQVDEYVRMNIIPGTLDIELQYNDGTGWKTRPGDHWTYTAQELMNGTPEINVPEANKYGQPLVWRFVEVKPDGTPLNGAHVLTCVYGSWAQVTPGGDPAVITNTVELGSIAIAKEWDDAEDVAHVRPDEITVYVYRDGSETPYTTVTLKASEGWTATVDDLPVYQDNSDQLSVYLVTEQDLSDLDYTANYSEPLGVTLVCGETASVGIENVLPMDAPELDKVVYINETCSQNETLPVDAVVPLAGAEFSISRMNDGEAEYIYTVSSDSEGHVAFKELPDGIYLIEEVGAPLPNKVSTDVWYAEIQGGIYQGLFSDQDCTIPVDENLVTDDVYRGSIDLTKVDEDSPRTLLPGCSFALYRASGNGRVLVAEGTTDEDGHLSFDGLLTGVTYEIVETAAAPGYYVSANSILFHFEVDEEGVVTLVMENDGNGVAEADDEGNIVWNDPPVVVGILKVDGNGRGLAGAKLQLADAEGNVIDTWTSTGEAYYLRGMLVVGQTYTLTELSAPAGYKVASPVTFTIEDQTMAANQNFVTEVRMVDQPNSTPPGRGPWDKTGGNTLPLIAFALVLIALGAGATGYGVRNRRKPQHNKR